MEILSELFNELLLIAQFMGRDIVEINPEELNYHKSWDSLMPVVEKIEEIYGQDIIIFGHNCFLHITTDNDDFVTSHSDHSDTKFLAIYKSVVDFIKYKMEE